MTRLVEGRKRTLERAASLGFLMNLTADDVLGRRRYAAVAELRQQLYVEVFGDGYSINEVALFTGRHHSTVISGMRRVLGDDGYDRALAERYPGSPFQQRRVAEPRKSRYRASRGRR